MEIRGDGYAFEAPEGWRVSRPRGAVVARSGAALVSVTRFPLRKPYSPTQFDTVAKALDGVADKLARAAGSSVGHRETVAIDGRQARAYTYGGRRIGFVLEGSREFQLYCSSAESQACGLLFDSFALS